MMKWYIFQAKKWREKDDTDISAQNSALEQRGGNGAEQSPLGSWQRQTILKDGRKESSKRITKTDQAHKHHGYKNVLQVA